MAMRCEICGKGPVVGRRVSHAHNVRPRRFEPNLQMVRPSSTAPASASRSARAASARTRSPRPSGARSSSACVKELVTAAGAAKAIGPYSPALKVGNLLFLSGSIPLDPVSRPARRRRHQGTDDARDGEHQGAARSRRRGLQQRRAHHRVHGRSRRVRGDERDLCRVTSPRRIPARSTVQVVKLPRDVRVEIDVIAVLYG